MILVLRAGRAGAQHFLYNSNLSDISACLYRKCSLMTITRKLSTLALALCSCCLVTATAQDSAKIVQQKRNHIAVKPFEWVGIDMFSRFKHTSSNVYNYYGFGLAYERSLRPGSRWSIALPVNVRQNLNPNEKATAVFFCPGIKYGVLQKGPLQYSIGLHAGASRESGRYIFWDMDGEYVDSRNRFRSITVLTAVNNTLAVPLTSSLSLRLEAGLSFEIANFSRWVAPYSPYNWSTSYGPYVYAMVNGGIALNYTF